MPWRPTTASFVASATARSAYWATCRARWPSLPGYATELKRSPTAREAAIRSRRSGDLRRERSPREGALLESHESGVQVTADGLTTRFDCVLRRSAAGIRARRRG